MRKSLSINLRKTQVEPLELMDEIQRIIPKIEMELVGSLQWYSQDAQYVPQTIRIISLEHSGQSRYKMNYSFEWSVFNACLDIDTLETSYQSVNIDYTPDMLVFDFIEDYRQTASDEL